jgi:hypothetical protein
MWLFVLEESFLDYGALTTQIIICRKNIAAAVVETLVVAASRPLLTGVEMNSST